MEVVYRFIANAAEARVQPTDAGEARRLLEDGNRNFCRLVDRLRAGDTDAEPTIIPCDARLLGAGDDGHAPQQEPFAVLLGCADARVPPQMIFQRMSNELFVVRVAGNVIGDEVLGSIEYAVEHLGRSMRLVVVLGHTGCGAVTAAVDIYLTPRRFGEIGFTRSLRSMIYRLVLPVRAAARIIEEIWGADVAALPGYRQALVETAVCLNAAETAFQLHRETSSIRDGGVEVVYGVYDLATQRVGLPGSNEEPVVALTPAPRSTEEFAVVVDAVKNSAVLRGLLGVP